MLSHSLPLLLLALLTLLCIVGGVGVDHANGVSCKVRKYAVRTASGVTTTTTGSSL